MVLQRKIFTFVVVVDTMAIGVTNDGKNIDCVVKLVVGN